jgi:hypothetical protein
VLRASVCFDFLPRSRSLALATWGSDPRLENHRGIVRLDEPPLRLLLGERAVESAEEASKARAAKAAKWAEVSRSAEPTYDCHDPDGATPPNGKRSLRNR